MCQTRGEPGMSGFFLLVFFQDSLSTKLTEVCKNSSGGSHVWGGWNTEEHQPLVFWRLPFLLVLLVYLVECVACGGYLFKVGCKGIDRPTGVSKDRGRLPNILLKGICRKRPTYSTLHERTASYKALVEARCPVSPVAEETVHHIHPSPRS